MKSESTGTHTAFARWSSLMCIPPRTREGMNQCAYLRIHCCPIYQPYETARLIYDVGLWISHVQQIGAGTAEGKTQGLCTTNSSYATGNMNFPTFLEKPSCVMWQEEGLDTVDANRALGLPDDCREYSSVRNILKELGIRSIRLMVRQILILPAPAFILCLKWVFVSNCHICIY